MSLHRYATPASAHTSPEPGPLSALLGLALLALAGWLIWHNAWVSDDAAITLRSVLNLLTGHGARFNIDERVQAYTHPLWFGAVALVTAAVGNAFLAVAWLGIVLSVAGLAGLVWLSVGPGQGLLAVVALLASSAFMAFSTSGLENPLSHLLLIAAAAALIRVHDLSAGGATRLRALNGFFLCAGLLYLSRPDLLLLLAPSALHLLALREFSWRSRARALIWAAIPVSAWTAFSLLYYGLPFPNTALAKLGTGIARTDLWAQGLHYVENTLANDPLTLALAALGVLLAPFVRHWGWGWGLGSALYLVYVIGIGGDFMAGRFFTAPAVAGAIVLARLPWRPLPLALLALGLAALGWPNAQYLAQTSLDQRPHTHWVIDGHGIADERSFYFDTYALSTISATDLALFRPARWHEGPRAVGRTCGGLGFGSIRGGPSLHVIDTCALADPLLARLPVRTDQHWRIGHFERAVPAGYADSIARDANLLTDPALHARYTVIRRITRAPLLEPQRLHDVAETNLAWARGRLDALRRLSLE